MRNTEVQSQAVGGPSELSTMSAIWGNSKNIGSLRVFLPVTQTGPPPADTERVALSREGLSQRDLLPRRQPPGFAIRIRKFRQLEIFTIQATRPVITGNPTSRAYARVQGDTRV